MADFTVVFLFNKDTTEVCLLKKKKRIYIGKLNGIGGEREPAETIEECAIREVLEEAKVDITNKLRFIVDCTFPNGARVWFGYAIVNKEEVVTQTEEQLIWLNVGYTLLHTVNDESFAGDGNVLAFINAAIQQIRGDCDQATLRLN